MRTRRQRGWLDYRLVSVAPPVDPVDSEPAREVRVSEYVQRVLRRWYVVVAAVAVAVLLIVLHGASPAHTVEGTATVYLGQPVTPGGGALFQGSPGGSVANAQATANSSAVLRQAAAAAGVREDTIAGNVAVHQTAATAATSKTTGGPATVQIIAQGSWTQPATARAIVAVLATAVQRSANQYQSAKLASTQQAIAGEQAGIHRLQQSIAIESSQIAKLVRSPAASGSVALAALLNQRSADADQLAALQTSLQANQNSIASIRYVEAAQIITPAAGRTVTATTRRSSYVIAAFIGLIVGCLIALAWEALRRPRTVG